MEHSSGIPHRHGAHPSPWQRWLELMRPERSDVTVVAIFSLVVGLLMLAIPIAVESLVNTVAFGNLAQPLIVLAFILFVCLAFVAVIQAMQRYVVEIFQRRIFVRSIATIAQLIPRARFDAFSGRSAALVNRYFELVVIDKANALLLMDGLFLVIQTLVAMIVLSAYHPYLLGFVIILASVMIFIVFVLGRGAVGTAITESQCKHATAAWMEELALHELAFKAYNGNKAAIERATQLAVNYIGARRSHFRILLRQVCFALGLQAVASTILLGLGGWLVINRQLTLGQLVAAELMVTAIVGAFAKFGKHLEAFYDLMASMDELGELLDVPIERESGEILLSGSKSATLTLRNVRLKSQSDASDSLTFSIPTRARVLLVGPPASGKSLLLESLLGLHDLSDGYVEINGFDLREIRLDDLRSRVGLVQEPEIIEGTVFENLALGRQGIDIGSARAALEKVGLLDAVMCMPHGIETAISASRPLLSRSQQFALMFARLIVDPPCMILIDGALDQLHGELQTRITDLILHPDAPWTVMLVTRREELILHCTHGLHLPEGSFGQINTKALGDLSPQLLMAGATQ